MDSIEQTAEVETEPTSEESDLTSELGSRVEYVHTGNLPDFFHEHRFSMVVTTYQAGRVLLFSSIVPGRLNMLMRKLPRPTGIAQYSSKLAIASKREIWTFRAARNVVDRDGKKLENDIVWLPRAAHVTGYIDAHQLLWNQGELLAVNTRYSCLCKFNEDWSFVPIWKPPFVSKLTPEDRCHLNGACVDQFGPKFATALGVSDEPEGWRENKASGGVVIDIPSGEVVASGLSMPHSPRLYGGKLWVLESGTGCLLMIDPQTGDMQRAVKFAGFLRGLAFYKHFAFVGLCKAREKQHFGDLPIEQEFGEFECGVSVVNLQTMSQEGFIHFTGGVEELFDIVVMPEVINPFMVGFEDGMLEQIKIVPPEEIQAQSALLPPRSFPI